MCEGRGEGASQIHRLRTYAVTAGIVGGGVLMLAGSIYGVAVRPGGPEELGTLWPFYLGGVFAIVLGWLNGDWRY